MEKINIQVLGSGCSTCKIAYEKVLTVTKKINSTLEVEYITDVAKMVELGVMSSPVFVIDGKIITVGKIPEAQKIKEAISEKIKP
jgi:small redox-active disulfide protein 2